MRRAFAKAFVTINRGLLNAINVCIIGGIFK